MHHHASPAVPMFVALDPEPRLAEMVWAYKRRVASLVGPQTYLDHPPHLTVFLAAFDDAGPVIDATAQLAATLAPPPLDVVGWHVFAADKLTGGNTLVCRLADENVRSLRKLQRCVIEHLSPLRNASASKARYTARWRSLDPSEQAAVRLWGFPYVVDGWRPHVTIASISRDDWPKAERELLAESPRVTATCPTFSVYCLERDHPVSLRSFALGSRHSFAHQFVDASHV